MSAKISSGCEWRLATKLWSRVPIFPEKLYNTFIEEVDILYLLIPLVVSSEGSERDGAGQQSGGRRGADHQLRHQHQGLLRQAAQVHELRH